MGTSIFGCGCSITRSMFGNREIMEVCHCQKHIHLYSENKTIKEMAMELEIEFINKI